MINKNLLLASLLTINSSLVLADSSSCKTNKTEECSKNKKNEELEKLINILFNKDDMSKTFNKSLEQVSQFMPTKGKSADIIKNMSRKLSDKMCSPEFKKQFIKIYDENFTAEEISDLLDFYNSKTGKKLIEKMPEIASESAKASNDMMQELMSDFLTKFQTEEDIDKSESNDKE